MPKYNKLKQSQGFSGAGLWSMPVEISGQKYYRTSEACLRTGVSRATLFRWLKAGILKKSYRDRRGWRMFTEDDLSRIRAEVRRIEVVYTPAAGATEKQLKESQE